MSCLHFRYLKARMKLKFKAFSISPLLKKASY